MYFIHSRQINIENLANRIETNDTFVLLTDCLLDLCFFQFSKQLTHLKFNQTPIIDTTIDDLTLLTNQITKLQEWISNKNCIKKQLSINIPIRNTNSRTIIAQNDFNKFIFSTNGTTCYCSGHCGNNIAPMLKLLQSCKFNQLYSNLYTIKFIRKNGLLEEKLVARNINGNFDINQSIPKKQMYIIANYLI